MADLTARFQMIDEMSDKLADISSSGQDMVETFEDIESRASSAFDEISGNASSTASSIDGVATSLDDVTKNTDYWTDAVGNYNKEALEFVYTTEELVDMGFKSEEALQAEADAAQALADEAAKAAAEEEELARQNEEAANSADKAGDSGIDAINGIASALSAAGITVMVKEIAEEVYNLANAFSDAESIIVDATGATGDALASLEDSMMASYSNNYNDLNTVASAIGEINTRMGLTGDELTEVTDLFLNFSNITGTDVVSSIQDASKIMNKYGLDAADLEDVLDQLAYAGQVSGASVDSLSSTLVSGAATFQSAGLSIDNAISMLADFELAGINSSTAVTGLRTAVNNFTEEGLDAQTALQDVIEEIYNMEDASDATALAVETFGSRAGQELALAIQNGTLSVDTFSGSLEDASGTIATTAEASLTLSDQWDEASNKMSTAFTTVLEPAVSSVSSALAGVVSAVGDFLIEHPNITKALTAIATGLGVAAVAIAGVAAVAAIGTGAFAALGTAISAAIWPITAIAAGVAALVAVITILPNIFGETADETAGMTATTREQYYALQDLNKEYEDAVEQYGETSEEALRLKYQVDDLTAAFEASQQTVEEFTAEVDNLCDSAASIVTTFQDANTEINNDEVGTLALIQKYEDLATQTDLTAAEQKQLEAVTKSLTDSYPDLIADLDSAGASAEDYVEAMKAACEVEAEEARQQQAQESYVEALQMREQLTEEIAKAEENLNAETERMDDMSGWTHFWTRNEWDDFDAYTEALDELNIAMMENDALIASIESDWADIAEAEAQAAEEALSMEDAMDIAYASIQDSVEALCAAYDEAYDAALESFQGQYGLFDEASASMDSTVEAAQAALDSQLAYWDNYLANIEQLKELSAEDLGVTQEAYESLMAYVQDGSEEAAGLAASMVENINSGNTEAVTELANTIEEVTARQEEAAATTAEWQTNFTEQMDEYAAEMADMITNDLNLSDEAADSASSTIKAYAQSLTDGGQSAVLAAESIARQVSNALAGANTSISVTTSGISSAYANGTTNSASNFIAGEQGHELIALPAHAAGTTQGEDFYMAGEQGPELIVGQPGSEVFPTRETDRLIATLNDEPQAGASNTSSEKHIVLDIQGGGSIEIGAGTDTETVLELIQDNLKPVLLSILKQEIYEEGDLSYEY